MAAYPLLPWEEGKEGGGRAASGSRYSFLAPPRYWVTGAFRAPPRRGGVPGAEEEGSWGERGCGWSTYQVSQQLEL